MTVKKFGFLLIVAVLIYIFSFTSFAVSQDLFDKQVESSGAIELFENLTEEQKELLEKLDIDSVDFEKLLGLSPRKIFDLLFEVISGNYKTPLKTSFNIATMIIAVSIASQFLPNEGKMIRVVSIFAVLCIALNLIIPLTSCITRVISAIDLSSDFMLGLIPVLASVITVSGNPILALSYNSMCFMVAQAVVQIANGFIRPLIQIILSLGLITPINDAVSFDKFIAFIKKITVLIMSGAATVFILMLTVKGMLADASDGVAVRGIRFLIGNVVPFIGGAISDAYISILGTLSLVKNTVAVFAITVIAVTNLPVITECICWIIAINLLEALTDIFSLKNISQLLSACASAVSLLTVLLLLISIVFILSIGLIMVIKGG